jgi:hypothetical protein
MTRDEYLDRRRCYEPKKVELIIVAEYPPISGKYFYDPRGEVTEALFKALMEQLSYIPQLKKDGLKEFQRRGWVLVDATYEPVNRAKISKRERDNVIERDYEKLLADLLGLSPNRSVPLILIKANVCRLLAPKLMNDGFNVLNERSLPFPGNGHQKEFRPLFAALLKSAGIKR